MNYLFIQEVYKLDYKIEQVGPGSGYIPGRVNLGIYTEGKKTFLIDTGGDDTSGRALNRLLEREGLKLEAIINTHSNADHVGGNAYLQKKTGCEVWASPVEACITAYPQLEPILLWSAFPFRELNNKFLRASPSVVNREIAAEGDIEDTKLRAYPLRGHFINMIGVLSPDGVFYIADSIFSEEIIDKYKLPVALDINGFYETLDFLENFDAEYFVPCHASPRDDIRSLVKINRDALDSAGRDILDICKEPATREQVLSSLCRKCDIRLNAVQYVLNFATVSAHLAYLFDKGYLEYIIEDEYMFWKSGG